MQNLKVESVSEYIRHFSPEIQQNLEELRSAILSVSPDIQETISYHMPAFKTTKVAVYFAAYKRHVGFYPTPSGITAFEKELAAFKYAKGSVQFPIDQPMPLDLVKKMTLFRVNEIANTRKKK